MLLLDKLWPPCGCVSGKVEHINYGTGPMAGVRELFGLFVTFCMIAVPFAMVLLSPRVLDFLNIIAGWPNEIMLRLIEFTSEVISKTIDFIVRGRISAPSAEELLNAPTELLVDITFGGKDSPLLVSGKWSRCCCDMVVFTFDVPVTLHRNTHIKSTTYGRVMTTRPEEPRHTGNTAHLPGSTVIVYGVFSEYPVIRFRHLLELTDGWIVRLILVAFVGSVFLTLFEPSLLILTRVLGYGLGYSVRLLLNFTS